MEQVLSLLDEDEDSAIVRALPVVAFVVSVCVAVHAIALMVRRAWHQHHGRCAQLADDLVRRNLAILYPTMAQRVGASVSDFALSLPASTPRGGSHPPSSLGRRTGAARRQTDGASPPATPSSLLEEALTEALMQRVRVAVETFTEAERTVLVTDGERNALLASVHEELRHRCWFLHREESLLMCQRAYVIAYGEYRQRLLEGHARTAQAIAAG